MSPIFFAYQTEDQRHGHVDRALLGKEEARGVTTEMDVVEQEREQDACPVRNQEPDNPACRFDSGSAPNSQPVSSRKVYKPS